MKSRILLLIVAWFCLVLVSFGWNLRGAERSREALALEASRAFFAQILVTRIWNAQHGGVYVPVTERTQPNPYLDVARRDIRVADDLTLTLVNPAFMTRQLAEIARERGGIQFHITSLKPIRPANAPVPWEAASLERFEQGVAESGEFFKEGGVEKFRYMAPLRTEQACLACHAAQGYVVGDVRGGISVTLPRVAPLPVAALALTHVAMTVAGIIVILVMGGVIARTLDRLRRLASVDALTGIPNRRSFNDTLAHELRRARRQQTPIVLGICDIDHFKVYNDNFGHQAGDDCLRRVALTLQQGLHRGGDFCARYGGEEFVLILPNTTMAGAIRLVEEIRAAVMALKIANPESPGGRLTVSFGIASSAPGDWDADTLLRRADTALYRAKQRGRNRVEKADV